MKRTYNKPIMLDTCVAEYLLGVKCEHDEIVQKNINEDLLIKYVKHHGFIMSVFSLFELLHVKAKLLIGLNLSLLIIILSTIDNT